MNSTQNNLTFFILQNPDGYATKVHTEGADGWHTDAYRAPYMCRPYRASVPADAGSLATFLEWLQQHDDMFIVRGAPNPETFPVDVPAEPINMLGSGEPLRPMTFEGVRRKWKAAEDNTHHLTPADPGRRWLYLDLDDAPPPNWFVEHVQAARAEAGTFDPTAHGPALARLAEWTRDNYLPEPFEGAGGVYQFSSSAGVKPWTDEVRLHFTFLADRPAETKSLKRWLDSVDGRRGQYVDTAPLHAGGVLYTAAPVFEAADGSRLPDPLDGVRLGQMDGAECVTLPECVAADRAGYKRQNERDKSRPRAQGRRQGTTEDQTGLTPAEVAEVADDEATAKAAGILEQAAEGMANTASGRHNAALYFVTRAFRLQGYLDAPQIEQTMRRALARAFHGEDDDGEIGRLIEHGRTKADRLGMLGDLEETTEGREDYQLYSGQTDPLDLDGARVALAETVQTATAEAADTSILAPPGTGKTYATMRRALQLWRDGETVKLSFPTNDLCEDKRAEFLALAREDFGAEPWELDQLRNDTVVRPKRTEETCDRFGYYKAASRATGDGGQTACKNCPLSPHNDEGAGMCGYWHDREEYGARRAGRSVVITTHALETLATSGTPRRLAIDWQGFSHAVNRRPETIAEAVPVVRLTKRQIKLTVDTPEDNPERSALAKRLPECLLEERPEGPEPFGSRGGDNRWVQFDKHDQADREAVKGWFADALADGTPDGREELAEAAMSADEAYKSRPFAMVAIDEAPLSSVLGTVQITRAEIEQLKRLGDLDFAEGTFGQLSDALADLVPGGSGGAGSLDAEQLAELLPEGSMWTRPAAERVAPDEAAELIGSKCGADGTTDPDDDGQLVAELEQRPNVRALDALAEAVGRGWQGATATKSADGTVTFKVPQFRPFDREQSDCTLYLDATGSELLGRVVLPGAGHREIVRETPENVDVYQTAGWSASKHETWRERGRGAARYRELFALAEQTANLGALHVVPKSWRVDPETGDLHGRGFKGAEACFNFDPLHNADRAGRVIHHNGTDARGANTFNPIPAADGQREGDRPCDTALVTAFYVPQREINALAERLELALALSDTVDRHPVQPCPKVSEAARREAEFQLQGAPTLQAIGRLRPALAERLPEGERVTIILADDRPLPGFDVDGTIDPDALALANGRRTGKRWTPAEVRSLIGPAVDAGGYIPSAEGENFDPRTVEQMAKSPLVGANFQSRVSNAKGSISNRHSRLKNDLFPSARGVFQILADTIEDGRTVPAHVHDTVANVKTNHGGDWSSAASVLGLEAVHFQTRADGSGQRMCALVTDASDVDAEDLAERLEAVGSDAEYVQLDGQRATVGADPLAEALDALDRETLDALADGRFNKGETHRALAEPLGVSASTARRRVRQLGPDPYETIADRAKGRVSPAVASEEYRAPYDEGRFVEGMATAPRFKGRADRSADDRAEGPEVAPRFKGLGDPSPADRAKSIRVHAAKVNGRTLAEHFGDDEVIRAVAPVG